MNTLVSRRRLTSTILLSAVLLASVSSVSLGQIEHEVEPAFPNLNFQRPVDLQFPDDGSDRLFVVEQSGRILSFTNDPDTDGTEVFLDIRNRVNDSGNEEGLLGLAFHPKFAENGQFFVYYTAQGLSGCSTDGRCSKVSRFTVDSQNPSDADPESETLILEVGQPFSNHNGGQIRFGPDSLLYLGLGDGGAGGDPQGNGQNRMTLLGSILRIDVDRQDDGKAYAIPADNPFVATPFAREIYAYGLRNPWRFSFDAETGELWTSDVGQNEIEEVDIIVAGGNYGWNIMEGNICYSPPSGCDQSGLILPVHTYTHSSSTGRSITGGMVYRGSRLQRLVGTYVYGDFVSGRIWGLTPAGEGRYVNRPINSTGLSISAFGEDHDRNLYFLTFEGQIYRLVAEGSTGSSSEQPGRSPDLIEAFPNPLAYSGTIEITLDKAGPARVMLFDSLGRAISTILDHHLDSGRHRLRIPSEALQAGTYLLMLETQSGRSSSKVVII